MWLKSPVNVVQAIKWEISRGFLPFVFFFLSTRKSAALVQTSKLLWISSFIECVEAVALSSPVTFDLQPFSCVSTRIFPGPVTRDLFFI